MLDTEQIIIVGFLFIIIIIIAAAIFVPSFQEKVLGSAEGETSIAGFITVKGASFVLLIIGLASLITYMSVSKNGDTKSIMPLAATTTSDAINVLKGAEDDRYSLQVDEQGQFDILANTVLVGSADPDFTLDLKKSKAEKDNYELKIGEVTLSNLKLDLLEKRLVYEKGNLYEKDKPYKVENTDFWFKIEDIKSVRIGDGTDIAIYQFRFGEGMSEGKIKWSENTNEYRKSDDGRLPNGMKLLQNTNWKFSYAISLGAGLFGGDETLHIEKINILLVEVKLAQMQVNK